MTPYDIISAIAWEEIDALRLFERFEEDRKRFGYSLAMRLLALEGILRAGLVAAGACLQMRENGEPGEGAFSRAENYLATAVEFLCDLSPDREEDLQSGRSLKTSGAKE